MIMHFLFTNHCFRPLLLFFIVITLLIIYQLQQTSSFVSAYQVNCGTGTTIIVEDLDLGTEPIIIDQCSSRRLTIRNVKTSQIQFKQHLRETDLHIHDITVISNRQGPLVSFRWLVDMRGVRVERVHRIYDETAINLPSTQDEVILFDLTGGVNLRESSSSGPGVIFQDNSIEIRGGNLGIGSLTNRLSFALIRARGDGQFRRTDNLIIRNNTIKMMNMYSAHQQQQQQGLVTNGDVDLHILDHEQTRFRNVKKFTFVDNKIIGMKTSQSIRALNMSLVRIGPRPGGVWDDLENLIFERNDLEADVQSSSGGISVSLFRGSVSVYGVRDSVTKVLGTNISFEDNIMNITRAVTRTGNVHLALVRFDDLVGADGYIRQIHTFSVSNNLAVYQNVGIIVDPSYSSSVKMNILSLPKIMNFDNSFTNSKIQLGRDLGGAFIVENNKMFVNTFRAKGSYARSCAGKVSIVGVLVASEEFHLWYSVQIRNLTIQPVSLLLSSTTETASDTVNKISFVDSSQPYFNSATPSSVESCHSLLQIGVVWFKEDLTFILDKISFRELSVDFSQQQQEQEQSFSSSSSSSSVSEVAARGREGYFDVFGVRFGKLVANDDDESSGTTTAAKLFLNGFLL